MSYNTYAGAGTSTMFADERLADFGPGMPFDTLDAMMDASVGVTVHVDGMARDPLGRLGMRTDQEHWPALFRIGQIVDRVSGIDNPVVDRQYMRPDGFLADLPADPGSWPEEVTTRLAWLAEMRRTPLFAEDEYTDSAALGVTITRDEYAPIPEPPSLAQRLGSLLRTRLGMRQAGGGRHRR